MLLADVSGFDLTARNVLLAEVAGVTTPRSIPYDTLVIAAGSDYAYFGHDDWREFATEVKTLESAVALRSRILRAFERAELATDPHEREAK